MVSSNFFYLLPAKGDAVREGNIFRVKLHSDIADTQIATAHGRLFAGSLRLQKVCGLVTGKCRRAAVEDAMRCQLFPL
jgi:hypothetical protein